MVFVFLLGALAVGGFYVGTRASDSNRMSKADRQELKRLRDFEAQALGLAHEHLAYGDPLATHIINIGRREIG